MDPVLERIYSIKKAEFPEYVERPRLDADGVAITFSQDAGKGFYDQIEDAIEAEDTSPFFDFSSMPDDWKVPEARPVQR